MTATAGSGSVSLAGGTIAGSSNCVITVNVTTNAAGVYNNTTGAVSATNGGTGNTASAILTAQGPTLGITKTHTGSFNPGQTGATYTVTVSNTGTASTSGTVTVTDTLPAGLTPTGPTGTVNGWTCAAIVGQNVSCTSADAHAAGSSYPALTMVANVAANASGILTNTATVSGGGDPTSHQASDPTLIGAQVQITGGGSITVTQGNSGTTTFTLIASSSTLPVTFACGGLPAGAACSFNPSSISTTASTPVILTVSTTADAAALPPTTEPGRTPILMLVLVSLLGVAGVARAAKKTTQRRMRPAMIALGLCLLGLPLLAGCGGGHHVIPGTPRGTSNVTVTAAGTGTSATTTVTLTVQ